MIRKLFPLLLLTATLQAQPNQATEKLAATIVSAWPAGNVATTRNPGSWGYEEGVLLDGLAAEWKVSKNPAEQAYIQTAVDKYILPDGTIRMNAAGKPYPATTHTLDDIELGRAVLFVYTQTHADRYAKAAAFLHDQLALQPRTPSGGFWHKQIYPNQMWLDGAYMAEPFRAQYAALFHHPEDFDDIAKQFLLMDEHMRAPTGGLLRHGWDESKQMPWADPKTGLSPQVWARAMGWYVVGLVDTLDYFPKDQPQRPALLAALNRTLKQVIAAQDPATHLWWQVFDKPNQPGNFPEASASCMFVYALAKAVHHHYTPSIDLAAAKQGWIGIQKRFIQLAPDGTSMLTGTVKAAGLGGTPYRSGSYAYYTAEPTGTNDAKGVGAYLLAGSELGK